MISFIIDWLQKYFCLFSGWLFTYEYYFETYSNKIINLMVEQLTKNPAWRFVWSEVCWLEKWWEKASQSQKDSFTRFKVFFILICTCRVSATHNSAFSMKVWRLLQSWSNLLGNKCLFFASWAWPHQIFGCCIDYRNSIAILHRGITQFSKF